VIAGGEDLDTDDAQRRDALTEEKARAILAKLETRRPDLRGLGADFAWAGFFGETKDSLPLIGPVPGHPNTWASFGYGGNGISFSCIAAEMLATHLAGRRSPNAGLYAVDRTG
jgi:glycine/D-amino acid oxidase-like deaminating enzyme